MSSSAYSVSLLRFKLYRFLPDIEPLYMSEKGQMVKQRKRTRQTGLCKNVAHRLLQLMLELSSKSTLRANVWYQRKSCPMG